MEGANFVPNRLARPRIRSCHAGRSSHMVFLRWAAGSTLQAHIVTLKMALCRSLVGEGRTEVGQWAQISAEFLRASPVCAANRRGHVFGQMQDGSSRLSGSFVLQNDPQLTNHRFRSLGTNRVHHGHWCKDLNLASRKLPLYPQLPQSRQTMRTLR